MTSQPSKSFLAPLALAAISIAVGLAAITHQSFWMDEGCIAFRSLMPSVKEWWRMHLHLGGSEVQMPVYPLLAWIWHHIGANSEYAMRLVNLPWLVIAVLALRRERFWPMVLLTSPFALYYAGELRPYAMQIAAGAVAAGAMRRVIAGSQDDFSGLHATAGASLLLAISSLTAAMFSAGLWLGVLVIRPDWLRAAGFWKRIAPWLCGALAIAAYYAWTMVAGYRAAGMGGNVLSIGFGFYELLGLTGLGPGRSEIRANPRVVIGALPVLLPAFACIAWAWIGGVRGWIQTATPRQVAGVACAAALPILVLAGVGVLMHFRVLGRHLSPVLPALLLPIAASLASAGWRKLPAVLAVGFGIASSLSLRFQEKHARADCRRATDIAIEALQQGKAVFWRADINAARFHAYGKGGWPMVNFIQTLETGGPTSLMFADIAIISRPELGFGEADHRAELRRNSFELTETFTGFEVWKSR